jgi:hypothetical protein
VVVNGFKKQTELAFLQVFRKQFLKNMYRLNLKDVPEDPREQDRLILEAELT